MSSEFDSKIAKGLFWETASKSLVQVISWVSTILVGRILMPDDYGVVAISGVYILLFGVLAEMGFSWGLINRKNISESQKDAIFWLSIILGITLFFIIYLISPFIASFYEDSELVEIMRISGVVLILSAMKVVPYAMTIREMQFKFNAIAVTASQLVNVVVVLSLAYSGYGALSLVFSVVAAQSFLTIVYLTRLTHVPKFCIKISEISEIVGYSSKVMASGILDYINNQTGTFILGTFHGARSTGYYTMSMTFSQMPVEKIATIFNRVTFPSISKFQEEHEHAQRIFLKLHKYLLLIAMPFYCFATFNSHELIVLLLTEKWAPMTPFFQVLLIYGTLRISYVMLPTVLTAMGYPGYVFRINIIAIVILPAAMIVGSLFGPLETVIAMVSVFPLLYILLIHKVLRILRLSFTTFISSLAQVFIAIFVSLLTLVVTAQVAIPAPDHIKLVISFCVLSFILVMVFFSGKSNRSELVSAINLLRK